MDYVAEDDAAAVLDHVRKCITQRCEVTSEVRLRSASDLVRTVQLHSIPVVDPSQEITLCKTAISDVTERKQAEAGLRYSEARHRAILDASLDAIITIDERGIIDSVNPATVRLFGYTVAEMVGSNVKILTPSPHQEMHDTYLANYLRTGQRRSSASAAK